MERKNTGQLSLVCTGFLRDNRQPRRLGSVLLRRTQQSASLTPQENQLLQLNFTNYWSLISEELDLPAAVSNEAGLLMLKVDIW